MTDHCKYLCYYFTYEWFVYMSLYEGPKYIEIEYTLITCNIKKKHTVQISSLHKHFIVSHSFKFMTIPLTYYESNPWWVKYICSVPSTSTQRRSTVFIFIVRQWNYKIGGIYIHVKIRRCGMIANESNFYKWPNKHWNKQL